MKISVVMPVCNEAGTLEEIVSRVLAKAQRRRFAFEAEFAAKVARKGFRICEVPIGYRGRGYAGGKKARWVDGAEAILSVFWFRFST